MAKLIELLFGCSHKRTTFPITLKNSQGLASGTVARTYIVCLDCGKEFPYDWRRMKLVESFTGRAGNNLPRAA